MDQFGGRMKNSARESASETFAFREDPAICVYDPFWWNS